MKKIVIYLKNITKYILNTWSIILPRIKNFIKRIIHVKINWLKKIENLSYKKIICFYFILFCLGRFLLFFNPIRFDLIHQILLTIISFLTVYSLKYAYTQSNKIQKVCAGLVSKQKENNCTSSTLKMLADQMINMQQSVWWLIITLLPPLNFIRKNIYLGFIEKTPSGYYAVIFAASTYYLALLGYVQIGIALVQFYKISHDKGGCIPIDFPHDIATPPEWLSLWSQAFQKIVKIFFVVGTLFTLEYILLIPKNVVTIKEKRFTFNVCDINSFLLSWGTIFVFIIIAMPIINLSINKMKVLAIHNLKKKINREYEMLFENKLSVSSPLDLWAYKQLIDNSGKYSNYIHTKQSIIPIASTLLSLTLNGIKLYESVLSQFLNV